MLTKNSNIRKFIICIYYNVYKTKKNHRKRMVHNNYDKI